MSEALHVISLCEGGRLNFHQGQPVLIQPFLRFSSPPNNNTEEGPWGEEFI